MKLLWHSNSPLVPTGYGNQTQLFTPLLKDHYELAISSFYGLQGGPIIWNDIPILPGLGPDFGGEYLPDHANHWFDGEPGMVFTLMDVWVLPNTLAGKLNIVSWTPVDHDPIQQQVVQYFATGAIPLAMSRFGQRQLEGALKFDEPPLYCPHGIDTDQFQPGERARSRELMGLSEDVFLVGMVAANKGRSPSRKGFQQAFEAFALFRDKHPEAHLYLHTCADPRVADGENLFAMLRACGIDPHECVGWANPYKVNFLPYTPAEMRMIYSGLDVLLNPAMGEGFGIPVLEAQACGVPVIVTDHSAMSEVGRVGWQVEHGRFFTGHNSWQAVAEVEDIVEALGRCHELPKAGRVEMAAAARTFALGYDIRRVFSEHMLPALKEAERRFADREPVTLRAVA